ncbi:hypothetical protein RB195_014904 [Necator americanus]|uniref:Core-2/I-Branching enzyme n=1 Tax=Necator americanus TaxID=51031 RepID=A0ABR1E232_NECAM
MAALAAVREATDQLTDQDLRAHLFDSTVLPALCYAAETWADTAATSRKLLTTHRALERLQYDVNRYGSYMNHAFYECLKLLITKQEWQYVLLMQNHDIMIKSVYETVTILDSLGGANDVHVKPCEEDRWNHSAKWDASSLKFYHNGKCSESVATQAQLKTNLTIARGAVQASLSRSAVDWMVNAVNLTGLLDQLNTNVLGVDEVLIPTLQVSDIFDMPGRFTGECVTKGASVGFMSRVALWEPSKGCHSGYFRHSVCVFGIEDFAWLPRSPRLMANKMMPDFDYAVVDCVHELLFNRTHLNQDDHPLNLTFYEDLPYVRYHKNRLKPNPDFKLVCKYGIPGDLSLAYRNISERSSLVNCTR